MKDQILKMAVYIIAIFACAILFVKIGGELFIKIAVALSGVPDRYSLPDDSGIAMIAMFFLIPEIIFGSIGGLYLGEWLSKKIWDA